MGGKGNKWVCAAVPAVLLHSCIGSVYCWSMLKGDIAEAMGVTTSSIEMAFSLAIFFLGMSAAFGGRLVERDVTLSSRLSTLCFCAGLVGAALSVQHKSVWALFLTYGVLMGVGLGLGYLSPVKTLMIWFARHKGLATGIAISGFGLSKVLFSPFIQWCGAHYGIQATLYSMAAISVALMGLSSALLRKPDNWVETVDPFSIRESWKIITDKGYIKIWICFYLNITCGLALIAYEKELGKLTGVANIALLASATAVFNTLGRLGYATLSDVFKRDKAWIYVIVFATSVAACLAPLAAMTMVAVVALLCVVNAGYGGGFSSLPVLLGNKFGMAKISTIHGFALSAWAWAGLSGNQLANLIINKLGMGYSTLITVIGVLFLVSMAISLTLTDRCQGWIRKARKA